MFCCLIPAYPVSWPHLIRLIVRTPHVLSSLFVVSGVPGVRAGACGLEAVIGSQRFCWYLFLQHFEAGGSDERGNGTESKRFVHQPRQNIWGGILIRSYALLVEGGEFFWLQLGPNWKPEDRTLPTTFKKRCGSKRCRLYLICGGRKFVSLGILGQCYHPVSEYVNYWGKCILYTNHVSYSKGTLN